LAGIDIDNARRKVEPEVLTLDSFPGRIIAA
jgi:hypothetical protein